MEKIKNHDFAYFAAFVVLLVVLAITVANTAKYYNRVEIISGSKTITLTAEVADTPEEWRQGLASRPRLAEGAAMLFVLPESYPTFWMKDMGFPIDIIFVSSDFSVTEIKENFQPCYSEPCERYTPKQAISYAIEVNAGFADTYGINIGDSVAIY